MRGSVQGFGFGFGFPDIEEQSMLAAKTGAKAKTVFDGFRSGLGLKKDWSAGSEMVSSGEI